MQGFYSPEPVSRVSLGLLVRVPLVARRKVCMWQVATH